MTMRKAGVTTHLKRVVGFLLLGSLGCCAGCDRNRGQPEVVVYTSLDQVFSQPILAAFERESGIRVLAVYDSESTKTTGLVNRLLAEKKRPRADVFWNSETGRTVVLKRAGVLTPYRSPQAAHIPAEFKDPQGYWTGFAARCRILIYNTQILRPVDLPDSIFDLTQPQWRGKIALAYPLFGTTATHAAALFAHLGETRARDYFAALLANDVLITDGNASARDRVVDGTVPLAFTDTDDALAAMKQGHPVDILWPDTDGCGTLLIPNTVACIKGGPHPQCARQLIDYLLSPAVEERLAHGVSGQIPLRAEVKRPSHVPAASQIQAMPVDYEQVAVWMEPSARFLQKLYVR